MAVKLPSIEITFRQLAGSLIERSARGIAVLIIKDDTEGGQVYKEYTNSAAVDEDKEQYTPDNFRYIKDVLLFQINKCVVIRISTVDGVLTDALKLVRKRLKTAWITVADGSTADFESLAGWIKAQELEGRTYKAVVYQATVTDCMHLVNFSNDKITFADDERGEQEGKAYCSSLLGILASCNIKRGCTYYKCANLSYVEEMEDNEKAVGEGKFILINNTDEVLIGAGINSMTTTNGLTRTEDMKYIETVEAMDIISDDIGDVFKNEYLGNYRNNYDNQVLFISAVNAYLRDLAKDYILDNNYNNHIDVDVEAQTNAWLGVGKTEAEAWDERTIKNNSFKRTVFLAGDIKILNSMENLKLVISLF